MTNNDQPPVQRPVETIPSRNEGVSALASAAAPSAAEIEALLPDHARHFARSTAESIHGAARVVRATERGTDIGKAADWLGVLEKLVEASSKLRAKDMSQVEDMLVHQAIALQAMFVRLSEQGLLSTSPHQFDIYLRYALRAQAQCRTTLEALAEIKNPPVVFARQANITTGNQQINNGASPRARGRENGSEQIEQSGGRPHELPANRRAPALARPTDTPMAPMGAVDGAEDSRGQVSVLPQRVIRHGIRTPFSG